MNLKNYKIPDVVTGSLLPNEFYKNEREEERYDKEVEREEQQIALLREQNELLQEQNRALKEANDASNKELKRSKCLNYITATIAFLTLVATILMPLLVK
ncbi:MAG: hypothetical protein IJW79_08595 [Clostridia bacterium]|nr:hypothetical protein [Clostridia bacterium]